MSYKALVSDWNGTLFKPPTDEDMFRKIGKTLLKREATYAGFLLPTVIGTVWKGWKIYGLSKVKKEIKKRLAEHKADPEQRPLQEVYEPFNEVLSGRPIAWVNGVIERYAAENAHQVDERMLRPIRAAHNDWKRTGILSVSNDHCIKKILSKTGYSDVFDVVVANTQKDLMGKSGGFTLEIYGEKGRVFESRFLKIGGMEASEVVYIGDSKDDEPIAEIVPAGNFVVPFFAKEDFKQYMAQKYKAEVPVDEKDFDMYLKAQGV